MFRVPVRSALACAAAIGVVAVAGTAGGAPKMAFHAPFSPLGAVFDLAQGADGAMYAGSAFGLERWDGFSAQRKYALELQSGSSLVYRVSPGPDGSLWLGFGGSAAACESAVPCPEQWVGSPGVSRLREDRITRLPALGDGKSEQAWALLAETDTVWVGTPDGIIRYRALKPDRMALVHAGQPLFVTAIERDDRGDLLIGTREGAFRVVNDRAEPLGVPGVVTRILRTARHGVWIATRAGLWMRPGGASSAQAFTRLGKDSGLPGDDVRALASDHSDTVWLTTRDGMARWRDGRFEAVDPGLGDDRVLALASDDEQGIWAGAQTGGVVRGWAGPAEMLSRGEGLPFRNTIAVAAGSGGELWALGQADTRMLVLIEGGRVVPVVLPEALRGRAVHTIAPYHDKTTFLGSRGAGVYFVDANRNVTPAPGIAEREVSVLRREGDALWVADRDSVHAYRLTARAPGGVAVEAGERWTVAEGLCPGEIADLAPAASGTAWAVSRDGRVSELRPGGARCLADRVGPAPISSLAVDAGATVWVGAAGGLSRLRRGARADFRAAHGLIYDNILELVLDPRGYLWTATQGGIMQIKRADLLRPPSSAAPLAPLLFDRESGLRSSEASFAGRPAATLASDGTLWVATADGLAGIRGDGDFSFPRGPRLSRLALTIGGAPGGPGPVVEGVQGQDIFIQYHAVALTFPRGVRYGYELTAPDGHSEFVYPPMVGLYLPRLAPGEYQLRAFVANAFGTLGDAPVRYVLRIVPRWTARPSTWAAVTMVLLALVIAVQGVRRRRALATAAAVQAERESLARDLHDSLGQGFSSLAFHLETAAIQMAPTQPGAEVVSRARSVLQAVQAETRRMIWQLREAGAPQVSLREGLQALAAVTGGKETPCVVELAPDFSTGDVRGDFELLQIAREAVTNAHKHAQARKILVEAQRMGGKLRLRVSDDGIGMDTDSSQNVAAGRFGLLGMQERARRIGGVLDLDALPGGGTVIEVTVPLR